MKLLTPKYDFPLDLKNLPCWLQTTVKTTLSIDGKKKIEFPPNWQNLDSLVTFDRVRNKQKSNGAHYYPVMMPGFHTPKGILIVLDVDHCINDSGVNDAVLSLVDQLKTRVELSARGTGLHIIGYVQKEIKNQTQTAPAHLPALEIFSELGKKSVMMTGHGHYYSEVVDITEHLPKIYALQEKFQIAIDAATGKTRPTQTPPTPVKPDSDDFSKISQIVEKHLLNVSNYDDFLTIGMAIHSHFGDAGWEIWKMFTKTNYTPAPTEHQLLEKWKSFKNAPDKAVTIASLYKLAKDNGYIPETPKRGLTFTVNNLQDEFLPPDFLVEEIIPQGELILITGQAKAGKSFFAINLSIALATGKTFLNFQTKAPQKVLYLNFELPGSLFQQRVADIAETMGDGVDVAMLTNNLIFTTSTKGKLGNEADVTATANAINELAPDVLVIDPFANIYAVRDENSNVEIQKAIELIWRLQELSGTTIILVHHAGKNADVNTSNMSGRGASALAGAVSQILSIQKTADKNIINLHFDLRFSAPIESVKLKNENGFFTITDEQTTPLKYDSVKIIIDTLIKGPATRAELVHAMRKKDIAQPTAYRRIRDAENHNVIIQDAGRYILQPKENWDKVNEHYF